jgi:hypothetical protein
MADANEIDEIIRKRKELEKQDKLNSEQYADRLEKEREKDAKRREMLFWQFKDYTGREMTETEYQRYLLDFKNTNAEELKKHNKIFNFFEWINQMGLKENGV